MTDKESITNWKLKEVQDDINIVHIDSLEFLESTLKKFDFPKSDFEGTDRSQTHIDWDKMPKHFKFFFDNEGEEKINESALMKSELSKYEYVILIYGIGEPAIKIRTKKFIQDWEDFLASTQWETIIFSEDLNLIIEITRDYYMHSNFLIRE